MSKPFSSTAPSVSRPSAIPKGCIAAPCCPQNTPDYIGHFTGISDPFELPEDADLILHTGEQTVEESVETLVRFVLKYVA